MTDSQPKQSSPIEEEIDLLLVLRKLWAGKWLIGGLGFGAALIGVVWALMLPNVYRAEALLAPNEKDTGGGLSALASQYGNLASLAGINLGGESGDKTALGLEILQSRKFVTAFIERRGLLIPLMAARGWDTASGELEIDPDIYDAGAEKWVRSGFRTRRAEPSMQEAYSEFRNLLAVSRDTNTGFVKVSIEFYSPETARQWVDWLVADLNEYVMQQDVTEAQNSIEYLNQQIANTSLAELQTVFFRLIEEQTKTVMLAKVSDEYLLKTLDPAVAPELKSGPTRSLFVLLAGFLGGLLGALIQLFRAGSIAKPRAAAV